MLGQSTISEESAANVQVTPMELAKAITSLEVKKAGIEGKPDTIALGEAVRQLEIDATPQELLTEVRALHSARKERVRSVRRRAVWQIAVIIALLLSPLTIWWFALRNTNGPVLTSAIPTPVAEASTFEPYPLLREVPNGMPVGVEYENIEELANGKNIDSLRVDAEKTETSLLQDVRMWMIEKSSDGVRVKAWAHESEALRLANGREALAYRVQSRNFALVPIEVDVQRFKGATPLPQKSPDGAYYAVRLKRAH